MYCAFVVVALATTPANAQPLKLLNVPFISQSEALCGGAAAAMLLRYWGAQGIDAESFAALVDRSAAGIRTDVLVKALNARGYPATGIRGDDALVAAQLERGRPVVALIEDRPGTYHYIVIVGWHSRGVVFHDPARAPFQVLPRAEFDRRWRAADEWMLVLTPPPAAAEAPPASVTTPAGGSACDTQIAEGVIAAQSGRLDDADRILTAAISCPGGAAYRELAGVRLLQRRWPEVRTLAEAALAEAPDDAHAWRLLGTARFIENDAAGALQAWNQVGEPRVDLIRVDGLRRTRQRIVEQLTGVRSGEVLTPAALRRAQRSVAELPSTIAASATFVPAGSALAQLRVSLVERPLLPTGAVSLGGMGLRAAANREIEASLTSLAGGGERVSAAWRFWRHRPLYRLSLSAPGPWRGVWELNGTFERQPFTYGFAVAERLTSRVAFGRWETSALRWSGGAGLERWRDHGAFGALSGAVRAVSPEAQVTAGVEVGAWFGSFGFTTMQASAAYRSSRARSGTVLIASGTAGLASGQTPPDLWLAGDTGHVRAVLSRAHPLLEEGRVNTDRLGRRLAGMTVEVQRWLRRGPIAFAPAVFVDAVGTFRRNVTDALVDTDVGLGIRVGAPVISGTLRLDVARGLRDGASAIALVYQP